ncbi:hypothetical protein HYPSUDRAFT_239311 [Hypholoma sublateritium FD-334 SS-4]|uniref:Uncharacterized protein n=1 Tax=Hypholoma sublateritium (strain FD-334 SS-4) TaxID=945553 RepID=A0A0D2LP30_HYPSF|nr:hypothetical protein HYPSUDRAFT_239311 [Hypholoma sublateritium FD-334 SS-4]
MMVLTALLASKWPCCQRCATGLPHMAKIWRDDKGAGRSRTHILRHNLNILGTSAARALSLSLQISGPNSLFSHQISPSVQPSPPTSARILLAVTAPTSPNRAHHRRDRCDTSKLPAPPVSETQLRPIFLNAGTRSAVSLYFRFPYISRPPNRLPYCPLVLPRQWYARRDKRATEYDAPRSSHVGVNKGY